MAASNFALFDGQTSSLAAWPNFALQQPRYSIAWEKAHQHGHSEYNPQCSGIWHQDSYDMESIKSSRWRRRVAAGVGVVQQCNAWNETRNCKRRCVWDLSTVHFWHVVHYTILYYTVLYCTVLYYTKLYYPILYVLYYTTLFYDTTRHARHDTRAYGNWTRGRFDSLTELWGVWDNNLTPTPLFCEAIFVGLAARPNFFRVLQRRVGQIFIVTPKIE